MPSFLVALVACLFWYLKFCAHASWYLYKFSSHYFIILLKAACSLTSLGFTSCMESQWHVLWDIGRGCSKINFQTELNTDIWEKQPWIVESITEYFLIYKQSVVLCIPCLHYLMHVMLFCVYGPLRNLQWETTERRSYVMHHLNDSNETWTAHTRCQRSKV